MRRKNRDRGYSASQRSASPVRVSEPPGLWAVAAECASYDQGTYAALCEGFVPRNARIRGTDMLFWHNALNAYADGLLRYVV
jgi:hypothetical protein